MNYIFLDDIAYLIGNKKKILFLYFFIPILYFFVNIGFNPNLLVDKVCFLLGNNVSLNNFSIIEIIMHLFNIFTILYINIMSVFKDLDYNFNNIFLRVTHSKWYIIKTIFSILIIIIMKLFLYITLITLCITFNNYELNVTEFQNACILLFKDIGSNIIMFQFLILILMLLTKRKSCFIVIPIILITVLIFSFNIYKLKLPYFVLLTILIINYVIIKENIINIRR